MTMRAARELLSREVFPDVPGVLVDRAAEFATDFIAIRDEEMQTFSSVAV